MNPEQKKQNDRLVSIISLALLVPFVVVVGYYLIEEINRSAKVDIIDSPMIEKGRPLSQEEVAEERALLPVQTVTENPTVIVTNNQTNTTNTSNSPEVYQVRMITETELADLIAGNSPKQNTPSVSMKSYNDAVLFTDVEIEQATTSSDSLLTQVLQGTVFEISNNEESLTIITPDKQTNRITLGTAAQVFINGNRISPADIAVGDLVRIEGSGSKEMIQAKTVTIIGSLEILFSN